MTSFILKRNKRIFNFESEYDYEELLEELRNIERTISNYWYKYNQQKTFKYHDISITIYDICHLYTKEHWLSDYKVFMQLEIDKYNKMWEQNRKLRRKLLDK